jgi:hypothetical protein
MTTPLPVLPQIIVEAGLVSGAPVQGSPVLLLDDATRGKLDTGTLGDTVTWTDLSTGFAQRVLGFSITRPSTRLAGPLWNYQAATATITCDNSDGALDPDNLAGPYVSAGITQLTAMVNVRIRAVWNGVSYRLYSGFADGWMPAQVTYEGGYAELSVPCSDAFKVLAGITLPAIAAEGAGADTGARVRDILSRAGWYTTAELNVISTGNSALQATTLGDTALNLMQLAVDSEVGQLYVNGAGAVVFRARHDLLTDTRSNTVQAVFGDLPGMTGTGPADGTFETGVTGWLPINSTAVRSSSQFHSGGFSAQVTVTGTPASATLRSATGYGTPVVPGVTYTTSAWVDASVTSTFHTAIFWFDVADAFLSTSAGTSASAAGFTWTQFTATGTAPLGADHAYYGPVIESPASGAYFYADEVFLWPGTQPLAALPELAVAAISRASDDTTIANDIQATRAGGTLQEIQDAASITKYKFPRSYSRSDLILQNDTDALNWAQWVLYIARSGEDRFESIAVDPQADTGNLWAQVLGREIGDRIQVWHRPASTAAFSKDCFIAGITHTWDSASSAWLTTWALQDATKYGSFLVLDNTTLGQLDANALAY